MLKSEFGLKKVKYLLQIQIGEFFGLFINKLNIKGCESHSLEIFHDPLWIFFYYITFIIITAR